MLESLRISVRRLRILTLNLSWRAGLARRPGAPVRASRCPGDWTASAGRSAQSRQPEIAIGALLNCYLGGKVIVRIG